MTSRERILPFLLLAGLLFLLMPVVAFAGTCIGFIAGVPVTAAHLPVLALVNAGLVYLVGRRYFNRPVAVGFMYALAVFMIFSVAGAWHLNQVFDNSFDGVWYHQEAVINLRNGWNPYYRMLLPAEGTEGGTFYDNHYPKSAWIAQSVVYACAGLLESSKVVNVWMMLGTLLVTCFALLHIRALPVWMSVALSILAGINPVSVYQLYAFYIDGQLGAGLMSMIVLLAASFALDRRLLFWPAAGLFVYAANMKFTGVVYASVLLACWLGYVLWKKRGQFRYYFFAAAATGLCALLVFGYPTYITNTISNGHPLYPIMGPGSKGEEIAAIPRSGNFEGKGRLHKFWLATFAEPMWCRAPLETKPKRLFRPVNDRSYFARADFEVSGFGPFYAEVFLLVLAAFGCLIVFRVPDKAAWLIAIAAIVFSAFLNSEVWYARYVPHLWLAVLLLAVALYPHRVLRWFSVLLVLGLLFNNAFLTRYYVMPHILGSREARRQINTLKKLERPVHIFSRWQVTFPVKAREYGLKIVPPPPGFDEKDYAEFAGFNTGWALYNVAELEEASKLPD